MCAARRQFALAARPVIEAQDDLFLVRLAAVVVVIQTLIVAAGIVEDVIPPLRQQLGVCQALSSRLTDSRRCRALLSAPDGL